LSLYNAVYSLLFSVIAIKTPHFVSGKVKQLFRKKKSLNFNCPETQNFTFS